MVSEIWSAILSGWPSVTDSEVNWKLFKTRAPHSLIATYNRWRRRRRDDRSIGKRKFLARDAVPPRCSARQQLERGAENRMCHLVLGLKRNHGSGTSTVEDRDRVCLVAEPDPFGSDVVAHHEIRALVLQLGRHPLQARVRLGGESDQTCPGRRRLPSSARMSSVGTRAISGTPLSLWSFVVETTAGR